METSVVRQYLNKDIQDLKESKPSSQALEQARFFLSLFKANKLLQQG